VNASRPPGLLTLLRKGIDHGRLLHHGRRDLRWEVTSETGSQDVHLERSDPANLGGYEVDGMQPKASSKKVVGSDPLSRPTLAAL
jgi:hypothetical protein